VSQSIVPQLIVKDLKVSWPLMTGSLVLGVLSLVVLPWSSIAFFVGGSVFIVTLVLLNVLLVSASLMMERKEKIRVFMLSLPASTTQYYVAKLLSSLIAYVVPATLLTLAAVILLVVTPLPNGFIPIVIGLSVHCLFYFLIFLSFALVSDSQIWMTTVIVVGNVSVSFVIPYLMNLTSLRGNLGAETAVWGADVIGFIAIELVLGAAALAISFVVNSKKTEFV